MRIRKELCMTKIQAVLMSCLNLGLPCNLNSCDNGSGDFECILVLFICHFFFFIGNSKINESIHVTVNGMEYFILTPCGMLRYIYRLLDYQQFQTIFILRFILFY